MATINLTLGGFQRRVATLESLAEGWQFLGTRPAVIDFYAPWCGPCRMLAPVLEELAEEYEGKIDIYKVNIDEEEALASAFAVRSVPTLILIPMQGAPQRSLGALPKPQLKALLDGLLNHS